MFLIQKFSMFQAPRKLLIFLKLQDNFDAIGSIVLSITGSEAIFASVGHFTPLSMQLMPRLFVYPYLLLTYLGQASYLLDHPLKVANVLFSSIPGGPSGKIYWYVLVLSTLATIITPQVLISGCFLITGQMMKIEFLPHFKIHHKPANNKGQIFVLTIFFLKIAVICTCDGFKSSTNVAAASELGILTSCLLLLFLFLRQRSSFTSFIGLL